MNPIERENYEFIRDTLQGKHETRYTMPKTAKFLVIQNGKINAKLEVSSNEKVIGYYENDKKYFFDNIKAKGSKTGFREVLRKQVDLV